MEPALELIRRQEKLWENLESRIITDPDSYWYGSTDITICNVTSLLAAAVPLYGHPQSNYYKSRRLLGQIERASMHLLRRQHAGGCISLIDCNIDSPPDTAFAVHLVGLAYKLLVKLPMEETVAAVELLNSFLKRAKECLLTGGIHTPNHRWVMCGALALLYELFPEEELKRRAFAYLNEGFDLTEYGEWTERSNAVYNAHCDLQLYHVYRVFGHSPSLEAARHNLSMMLYMLHPNGEIVTEYSSRQDMGKIERMNGEYEIVYRLMAAETKEPMFAAMARLAADTVRMPTIELLYWMVFPELMRLTEPAAASLPDSYTVLFHSGREVKVPKAIGNGQREGAENGQRSFGAVHGAAVLRHRRGPLSVTVMAGQPDWLYLQYGDARLVGLRLAVGFFGLGGVSFPSIRRLDDETYRLEVELEWGYLAPLNEAVAQPYNGSFVDMPNSLRELTHVCRLPVTVDLTLEEHAVNLSVAVEQAKPLIVQLVASFDPAGGLAGEHLKKVRSSLMQLHAGEAEYRTGSHYIRLSPGAHEHEYAVVRGDSMNEEHANVTVNWMGPVRKQVRIECGSCQ
jgi:hypothetical protein